MHGLPSQCSSPGRWRPTFHVQRHEAHTTNAARADAARTLSTRPCIESYISVGTHLHIDYRSDLGAVRSGPCGSNWWRRQMTTRTTIIAAAVVACSVSGQAKDARVTQAASDSLRSSQVSTRADAFRTLGARGMVSRQLGAHLVLHLEPLGDLPSRREPHLSGETLAPGILRADTSNIVDTSHLER